MKQLLAVLVVAVSAAMAAGPATAQQKTVIKFAHHAPVTFPYQDGALKFKEVAERLSGGRIEVRLDLTGVECLDCVVPPDLLEQMVTAELQRKVGGAVDLVLDDPRRI